MGILGEIGYLIEIMPEKIKDNAYFHLAKIEGKCVCSYVRSGNTSNGVVDIEYIITFNHKYLWKVLEDMYLYLLKNNHISEDKNITIKSKKD